MNFIYFIFLLIPFQYDLAEHLGVEHGAIIPEILHGLTLLLYDAEACDAARCAAEQAIFHIRSRMSQSIERLQVDRVGFDGEEDVAALLPRKKVGLVLLLLFYPALCFALDSHAPMHICKCTCTVSPPTIEGHPLVHGRH